MPTTETPAMRAPVSPRRPCAVTGAPVPYLLAGAFLTAAVLALSGARIPATPTLASTCPIALEAAR